MHTGLDYGFARSRLGRIYQRQITTAVADQNLVDRIVLAGPVSWVSRRAGINARSPPLPLPTRNAWIMCRCRVVGRSVTALAYTACCDRWRIAVEFLFVGQDARRNPQHFVRGMKSVLSVLPCPFGWALTVGVSGEMLLTRSRHCGRGWLISGIRLHINIHSQGCNCPPKEPAYRVRTAFSRVRGEARTRCWGWLEWG
jgi:hypothetical protein